MVGQLVAFIGARGQQYPALYDLTRGVEAFPAIVQRIDAIIDPFCAVRDGASPELA